MSAALIIFKCLIEAPSESWKNPFQCDEFTSSDVEEAYPAMVTMQQLDSNHEEDSNIDIL